jgi:hypothetical protein
MTNICVLKLLRCFVFRANALRVKVALPENEPKLHFAASENVFWPSVGGSKGTAPSDIPGVNVIKLVFR